MHLKNILVPIDFSPGSLEAASVAVDMARRSGGGTVTLLHVIDVIVYDYGWLGGSIAIPRDVVEHNHEKIREELERLVTRDDFSGVKVSTHLVEGIPFDEIVKAAAELDADLIVIGTHGHRGFSHLFLGSVAERVVRLAPCPVLTVKAEPAKKRSPAARR